MFKPEGNSVIDTSHFGVGSQFCLEGMSNEIPNMRKVFTVVHLHKDTNYIGVVGNDNFLLHEYKYAVKDVNWLTSNECEEFINGFYNDNVFSDVTLDPTGIKLKN